MTDTDAKILASNPHTLTTLAVQLEACMLADDNARAAYERIYGRPWQPLDEVWAEDERAALALARESAAHYDNGNHASADARTCVA